MGEHPDNLSLHSYDDGQGEDGVFKYMHVKNQLYRETFNSKIDTSLE